MPPVSKESLPKQAEPVISSHSRAYKPSKSAKVKQQTNKGKRSVGKLVQLMEMPVDIFYEMASHLELRDILHLSRTSKRFRDILMSKRSKHLWAVARQNVPGVPLPECPLLLSEPRFASLLYDRTCMACGVGRCVNVDYALRVRFCSACYKVNVVYGFALVTDSVHEDREKLFPLVPHESDDPTYCPPGGHKVDVQKNTFFHKYYMPELGMVAERYWIYARAGTAELEQFIDERKEFATSMQEYGNAMLRYLCDSSNAKAEAEEDASSRRKTSIITKLEELGYTPDDFPDTTQWWKALEAPRDLTPRVWKTLQPELVRQLAEEKARKDAVALANRIILRSEEAADLYDEFCKTLEEQLVQTLPNRADVCKLPSVKALIEKDNAEVSITADTFSTMTDALLSEAQKYVEDMKHDLIRALGRRTTLMGGSAEADGGAVSADEILARAYALFSCSACRSPMAEKPMAYPAINDHWRTQHPEENWAPATWPRISKNGYSLAPYVEMARIRSHVIQAVLDTAGLPQTATRAEVDELLSAGRLHCACGNRNLPERPTCVELIAHVHGEVEWDAIMRRRSYSTPNLMNDHDDLIGIPCLTLLPEGEAPTQPAYDADSIAVISAYLDKDAVALCEHCFRIAKSDELALLAADPKGIVRHMKSKHRVEKVTEHDLTRRRMWGFFSPFDDLDFYDEFESDSDILGDIVDDILGYF